MEAERYSDEFKEQVLRYYEQIGNAVLVVRTHETSEQTMYAGIRAKKHKQTESPVEVVIGKNELEPAILIELRDKVNSR